MANTSGKSTVARLTGANYDDIKECKFVQISAEDQKKVTDFLKEHEAQQKGKTKNEPLKFVKISKEDQEKVKKMIDKDDKDAE